MSGATRSASRLPSTMTTAETSRDAHDDRDVDALDRLPGELADARPAEHALDHHDAAHEDADVDADHGDDRQDGVGQRVDEHDARRAAGPWRGRCGRSPGAARRSSTSASCAHTSRRRAMPSVSAGRTRWRERAVAADREPAEPARRRRRAAAGRRRIAAPRRRRRRAPSAPGRRGAPRRTAATDAHASGRSAARRRWRRAISSSVAGRRESDQRRDLASAGCRSGRDRPAARRAEIAPDTARQAAGRGRAGGGCSRPSRAVALRPAIWRTGSAGRSRAGRR